MERVEIKEYKETYSKNERKLKARTVMSKYQGKLPLILLPDKRCDLNLPSAQYLVAGGMTVGNFIYALRRSLNLPQSKGLYLFLSDILPMLNSKMSELYQRFADEDGFLYFVFSDQEDKGV